MGKEEIKQKVRDCVRQMQHGENIKKILLFGSHLHGDARADSDVDLLIELQENIGLFEFVGIQELLSRSLQRPVDLGQPDALSKYIKEKVLDEAEVIYERT